MVRQQPLRDIRHRFPADTDVENDGEKLPVTECRGPAQFQLLARTLVRRHLAQHEPVTRWPGAILVAVAHGISLTIVNSARDQQRYSQTPASPARPGTYGQQMRPWRQGLIVPPAQESPRLGG